MERVKTLYLGGNVTIMVSDFRRSLEFYTETLHLPLLVRYGDDWAEVQGPGIKFGIHPTAKGGSGPQPDTSGSVSFGLEVDNLESAVEDLSSRGVKFGPINEGDPAIRATAFADPDGYRLYLFELRAGADAPQPTSR